MPQANVFYFFLALSAVIVVVFVWVALSASRAGEINYQKAYGWRRLFFIGLLAVLLTFLAITLPAMPYPTAVEKPTQVVYVVGKMFSFALSTEPITTEQQWEEHTFSEPVQIPAGMPVEFRVSSFDVNHGFSIYDPDNHLLGQTQAMPGYINRLWVKLDRPGRYTVLCLEFCGMGHHRMRGVFDVK
jgi:cytochrome c oxidase subunit 2